ncbi:peptidoglycan-binding domain-containing protein [Streptomyces longwoodensis]|uniref:peptidoglycan-binding domain-containing protein n=1 Tax=Streptomyces longwoodensis TaxID=68231 RepID=UPI000AA9FE79|nr:peptidoglycan-binding protein [Streptomyces longwoodensis]
MKASRILHAALLTAAVLTGAPVTAAAASASSAGASSAPAVTSANQCAKTRPFLSRGDQGSCVRFLQRKLDDNGIPTRVDGVFGRGTAHSVKVFQRACGFQGKEIDGLVGPRTWAGLLDHSCV